ncbi:hypothetical protein SFOMI_2048 [Sphingobium fuliginis]|uniref:Uncharacterized protein n=1 Tax=Sphingobium fuliginis (strain ATCC 27551) TaxID=336203 RepID=A0A292ZF54_SPHSA|nr:hypothetical protein SFOMI_2048 [Sphingobium fuliginis]
MRSHSLSGVTFHPVMRFIAFMGMVAAWFNHALWDRNDE